MRGEACGGCDGCDKGVSLPDGWSVLSLAAACERNTDGIARTAAHADLPSLADCLRI
eukprot:gene7997-3009_t